MSLVSRRLGGLVAALATLGAAWVTAQSRPPVSPPPVGQPGPQGPPVFRSGIELIQVDVSVLDQERRPVRGLTIKDFRVYEDWLEQPIVAFVERTAPDPDDAAAMWTRLVPPDVKVNNAEDGRLLLLVLDDATSPIFRAGPRGGAPTGPEPVDAVKNAARAVIDRMGPADVAAVIFTVKNRGEQEFTSDRTRLLGAIDAFETLTGDGLAGGFNALRAASTFRDAARILDTLTNRRKALIYISPDSLGVPPLEYYPDFGVMEGEGRGESGKRMALKQTAAEWAVRANVAFYHVNPFHMTELDADPAWRRTAPDPTAFEPPPDRASDLNRQGGTMSSLTGGFTIVRPGQLGSGIEQIMREVGSYYLLGYRRPDGPYSNKIRRIHVEVAREGLTLRGRQARQDEKPPGRSTSALHTAIVGLLPTADIAMRVNIAPFAIPGKDEAALAITVGLRQPGPQGAGAQLPIKEVVSRLTRAFTPEGKSRGKAINQVVGLDLRPAAGSTEVKYELLTRLDLKPGRYHLRLAASSAVMAKSASIYEDIEIPDFEHAPLSVSGIVLSATPPLASGPASVFRGLLPVVPTTQREFAGHRATAFFRVYQGGKAAVRPVTILWRITDSRDRLAIGATEIAPSEGFVPGKPRAADRTIALPLERLSAGEHLLSVEAVSGADVVRRDVRFTVLGGSDSLSALRDAAARVTVSPPAPQDALPLSHRLHPRQRASWSRRDP